MSAGNRIAVVPMITLAAVLMAACFGGTCVQAGIVTWDGGAGDGLWASGGNWSGTPDNTVPGAGDIANISTGATVSTAGLNNGLLPTGVTVNLSGNSTLTDGTSSVLRVNKATINVGSGSTVTGDFWDLQGGSFVFHDGAIATMNDWEQKDLNVFTFNLGAAGFTPLAPKVFRIGNGMLTGNIANATYNVDMAQYTGPIGVITLVDFTTDGAAMNNVKFQTAGGLNVLNAGNYIAHLQWNDTTEAIELNITATTIPTPAALPAAMVLMGLIVGLRRR